MFNKLLNRLTNNRGNSLIGAIVVMVVLAGAAVTIVNVSGSETRSSTNNMQLAQAKAVANAGIQYALDKLNNGQSPDVENMSFDPGSFTVVSDVDASTITVTASVGPATVTQSLNANFSKDCVTMSVTPAIVQDEVIYNIGFEKTCNNALVLTSMVVDWDWSECATDVGCDGDVAGIGDPPNNKYWICHVPPGQPENSQTLGVNDAGWINGHNNGTGALHNSDYIGVCPNDEPTVTSCPTTADSVAALAECTPDDQGATVTQVQFNYNSIFLVGSIPDASATAVASGETIDVQDTTVSDDGEYNVDVTFSSEPPFGGWYTVTFNFQDGSSITRQFRVGEVPDSTVIVAEGFTVDNGEIEVEPSYQIDLDVIGSEITCGVGGAAINVTTQLCKDGACTALFGGAAVSGGESYNETSAGLSTYAIRATGSLAACNNFSSTYSTTNTTQVNTLVAGDAVPGIDGYADQQNLAEFLQPYMDLNGNIAIEGNQVIFLFEIGTNIAQDGSENADYQDLVMIMTITQVNEN